MEPNIAAILIVCLLNSLKNLTILNDKSPNNDIRSIEPKRLLSEKDIKSL